MRGLVLMIFSVGVLWCGNLFAQESRHDGNDSLSAFLQFEDASPLSCLLTYFPPFFIQHGLEMKSFLRSKTFRSIRSRYGDRRAVDAIFIRAMQLTNNNTGVSLLLCTIACMDHRIVGVKVPLLAFYLPLSNESEKEFTHRINTLPMKLFDDTPPGSTGDRDKLQHFFGSTFLTFVFESRESAERFGDFIEEGEDAFIVEGVIDERDKRANRCGQRFGVALLDDNHRLPSEFLAPQVIVGEHANASESKCIGVW